MSRKGARKGRRGGKGQQQQQPSRDALLPSPAVRTYKFERTESIGALTIPAADGSFNWSWTLGDLPSVSELTSLFQEYRVDRITVNLTWNSANGTTSVAYPVVYAIDATTGITPASTLNDYLQRPYRKMCFNQSHTEHSFSIRPCIRAGADVGGTSSGRIVQRCPWLASSSTGVTLNGISAWIANYNTTSAPGTLQAIARFHVSCRGMM